MDPTFDRPFDPSSFGLGAGAPPDATPPAFPPNPVAPPQPSRFSNNFPSLPATSFGEPIGDPFSPPGSRSPFITVTPTPQSPGDQNLRGRFASALEQDRAALQGAADRQFNRLDAVNSAFAEGLVRGGQRVRETGMAAVQSIEDLTASQRTQFEADRARIVSNFKDLTAQQGAATTLGLRRAFENNSQTILSNPSLTPQQRQSALNELRAGTNEQITASLSRQGVAFNQNLASLESGLSAQSVQLDQIGAQLRTFGEQIRVSSESQALQFDVLGLTALASMIRNNPESDFSRASGLAQLLALSSAPTFTSGFAGGPGGRNATNDGDLSNTFLNDIRNFQIQPSAPVGTASSPASASASATTGPGATGFGPPTAPGGPFPPLGPPSPPPNSSGPVFGPPTTP